MNKIHESKEFVDGLLAWYDRDKRDLPWRHTSDPYKIWLSEIMLQQTRVSAVIGYYDRFLRSFPDVFALARAGTDELMKAWEGLGYYSRARSLQKCARLVAENYGGQFPKSYEELAALPGIGEYTAGAVASIAFGLPVPAVDGNVVRVLSRYTQREFKSPAAAKSEIKQGLAELYPYRAGDFTQAIMELGATVCLPVGAPDCGRCPLCGLCLAQKNGVQGAYPAREPKKPRRVEDKTIVRLRQGGLTAVTKRPPHGLLAGLYQFITLDGAYTFEQLCALPEFAGAGRLKAEKKCAGKHIFTHVEWRITAYYVECELAVYEGALWVSADELERYALPAAFRLLKNP